MKKTILAIITLPFTVLAETMVFTWQHANDSNTVGYIFEASASGGEWEEVGRTKKGVREFALIDSEKYQSARVWAYNIDQWTKREIRSRTPAENLRGSAPESAAELTVKETTVTENITRTTTTRYQ